MENGHEDLKKILSVFHRATDLNLLAVDSQEQIWEIFGETTGFCRLLNEDGETHVSCGRCHKYGGRQAFETGDCFFFDCPCGLTLFSVALTNRQEYSGYLLGGPFLMEYPDLSAVENIAARCNVPKGCLALLYSEIKNIPLIDPAKAYYFGELLFLLVTQNMPPENKEKLKNKKKRNVQQRLIAESIHEKKRGTGYNLDYQTKQELELAEYVEKGELKKAYFLLNDILGGIYFSSGNNIELIKIRVTELITVLSRRMIRRNVNTEKLHALIIDFQKKISATGKILDISEELGRLLEKFVEILNDSLNPMASGSIQRALHYLNAHYNHDISLEEIAEHISVSPTWFSRQFKKEMGIGYAAYVTKMRLNKACQLLVETDTGITDIAQLTGFSSQQYFTRVFTRQMNLSPGEYRRHNRK